MIHYKRRYCQLLPPLWRVRNYWFMTIVCCGRWNVPFISTWSPNRSRSNSWPSDPYWILWESYSFEWRRMMLYIEIVVLVPLRVPNTRHSHLSFMPMRTIYFDPCANYPVRNYPPIWRKNESMYRDGCCWTHWMHHWPIRPNWIAKYCLWSWSSLRWNNTSVKPFLSYSNHRHQHHYRRHLHWITVIAVPAPLTTNLCTLYKITYVDHYWKIVSRTIHRSRTSHRRYSLCWYTNSKDT